MTYFQQCEKCGKGLGQIYMAGGGAPTARYCDDCRRIMVWIPELVAALKAALQEQK